MSNVLNSWLDLLWYQLMTPLFFVFEIFFLSSFLLVSPQFVFSLLIWGYMRNKKTVFVPGVGILILRLKKSRKMHAYSHMLKMCGMQDGYVLDHCCLSKSGNKQLQMLVITCHVFFFFIFMGCIPCLVHELMRYMFQDYLAHNLNQTSMSPRPSTVSSTWLRGLGCCDFDLNIAGLNPVVSRVIPA